MVCLVSVDLFANKLLHINKPIINSTAASIVHCLCDLLLDHTVCFTKVKLNELKAIFNSAFHAF